jgi:hypothetical protein
MFYTASLEKLTLPNDLAREANVKATSGAVRAPSSGIHKAP